MYEQEKLNPYGKSGEKGKLVEEMFDNIAPTYDTLNHRLSWQIDRTWRNKAINSLRPYSPKTILDVATGTGDLALLAARKLKPESITGIDLSEGMMQVGHEKVKKAGLEKVIGFRKENCEDLSFDDNSFDAVIAAFGIRNFSNLDKGLSEMCRVMRRGGRLCIVELTEPVSFPMRQLFHLYSHTILPAYGSLLSHDRGAYSYLTGSIEAFPQGERMMQILSKAGFAEPQFRRLTFGICTMYMATKH